MSTCKKKPCGCEDTGLTTPSPCEHDTPQCPDPDPCCEYWDAQCVLYNGEGNDCLEVTTGQRVSEVLDVLMTELASLKCLTCPTLSIPATGSTDVSLLPTLTWNASPTATMYDVYFGTDPDTLALISQSQAGTSYTFTGDELIIGTVYYWKIVAKNATGSSGTDCPVFTFTTVGVNCTNPIVSFMNAVLARLLQNPQNTYDTVITEILTDGYVMNACDTCCPDCTQTDRYFFGGFEAWSAYAPVVYSVQTCPPPCCVNKVLSLANLTLFNTLNATTGTPPGGCCDDFSTCFASLAAYTETSGTELIEESSFKDSSGLCTFLQWFTDNNVTPADAALALDTILTRGLVIHCLADGSVIIAGTSAYTTWYTNTSQPCYNL